MLHEWRRQRQIRRDIRISVHDMIRFWLAERRGHRSARRHRRRDGPVLDSEPPEPSADRPSTTTSQALNVVDLAQAAPEGTRSGFVTDTVATGWIRPDVRSRGSNDTATCEICRPCCTGSPSATGHVASASPS